MFRIVNEYSNEKLFVEMPLGYFFEGQKLSLAILNKVHKLLKDIYQPQIEFLVSKKGIGYLILYGSQVFNLDLVISGILLLVIISYILYKVVEYIEKLLLRI